jgi:hypothetical protein
MKPTRVTSSVQPDKEYLCMTAAELARVLSEVIFSPAGQSETRIEDVEHGTVWVINVRKERT